MSTNENDKQYNDPYAKPKQPENTVQPEQDLAGDFDFANAKPVERTVGNFVTDSIKGIGVGTVAAADSLLGVSDMQNRGNTSKAIRKLTGVDLKKVKESISNTKSDVSKAQQREYQDADGVGAKLGVALSNPSLIASAAVESLPSMAVGALAGRGVSKLGGAAKAGVGSAAIGEGLTMAGSQANAIRDDASNPDRTLTGEQVAYSAATGLGGALFGFLGGKVAQKLGVHDIETAMTTGRLTPQQALVAAGEEATKVRARDIPISVMKGAIAEGLLEELPQSLSEQIFQNLATGKDWATDLDDAAVMGTLAGAMMGGGMGGLGKASQMHEQQAEVNRQSVIEQMKAAKQQRLDAAKAAAEQSPNTPMTNASNVAAAVTDGGFTDVAMEARREGTGNLEFAAQQAERARMNAENQMVADAVANIQGVAAPIQQEASDTVSGLQADRARAEEAQFYGDKVDSINAATNAVLAQEQAAQQTPQPASEFGETAQSEAARRAIQEQYGGDANAMTAEATNATKAESNRQIAEQRATERQARLDERATKKEEAQTVADSAANIADLGNQYGNAELATMAQERAAAAAEQEAVRRATDDQIAADATKTAQSAIEEMSRKEKRDAENKIVSDATNTAQAVIDEVNAAATPTQDVEPATEVAPEPATEVAPEPTTEVAPEPATEVAPEPATEVAPEPATEVTPEPATEVAPEPATEITPEAAPVPDVVKAEAVDAATPTAPEIAPTKTSTSPKLTTKSGVEVADMPTPSGDTSVVAKKRDTDTKRTWAVESALAEARKNQDFTAIEKFERQLDEPTRIGKAGQKVAEEYAFGNVVSPELGAAPVQNAANNPVVENVPVVKSEVPSIPAKGVADAKSNVSGAKPTNVVAKIAEAKATPKPITASATKGQVYTTKSGVTTDPYPDTKEGRVKWWNNVASAEAKATGNPELAEYFANNQGASISAREYVNKGHSRAAEEAIKATKREAEVAAAEEAIKATKREAEVAAAEKQAEADLDTRQREASASIKQRADDAKAKQAEITKAGGKETFKQRRYRTRAIRLQDFDDKLQVVRQSVPRDMYEEATRDGDYQVGYAQDIHGDKDFILFNTTGNPAYPYVQRNVVLYKGKDGEMVWKTWPNTDDTAIGEILTGITDKKLKARILAASREMFDKENAKSVEQTNRVEASESVPSEIVKFVSELTDMLGMKTKYFIGDNGDLLLPDAADKYGLYGNRGAALFAARSAEEGTVASTTSMGEGAFAININTGTEFTPKLIEALAHEIGHNVQREHFDNASPEVKEKVEAAYRQWKDDMSSNTSIADLMHRLRNRHIAEEAVAKGDNLSNRSIDTLGLRDSQYYLGFSEWFADQVSRWATSQDAPLTVVEKFFADIGAKMRAILNFIGGRRYDSTPEINEFLASIPPLISESDVGVKAKPKATKNATPKSKAPKVKQAYSRDQYDHMLKDVKRQIQDAIALAPKDGFGTIIIEGRVDNGKETVNFSFPFRPKGALPSSRSSLLEQINIIGNVEGEMAFRREHGSSAGGLSVTLNDKANRAALNEALARVGDSDINITVKVPYSETEYTVANTKGALAKLLSRIEKNSAGFRPVAAPRPSTNIANSSVKSAVSSMFSDPDKDTRLNVYQIARENDAKMLFVRGNTGAIQAMLVLDEVQIGDQTLQHVLTMSDVLGKQDKIGESAGAGRYLVVTNNGLALNPDGSAAASGAKGAVAIAKNRYAEFAKKYPDKIAKMNAHIKENNAAIGNQAEFQAEYEAGLKAEYGNDIFMDDTNDLASLSHAVGTLHSTLSNFTTGANTMESGELRNKLGEHFGKDTIHQLETQGKLRIVDSAEGMAPSIEGYFAGGQVTLVAGNITEDNAIPVLMHELGGHAGFQGLMSERQYQRLMKQFDTLVAKGNPAAIEANRLAMRESDQNVQRLEQLPYLLTVATKHMRDKNVLRRSALANFIGNLVSNVKAFAFDKLGINVQLSLNDMVKLGERMITKAANPDSQIQSRHNKELYSMQDIRDVGNNVVDTVMATKVGNFLSDFMGTNKDDGGRVAWWFRSFGTMYHLAESEPDFKPVFNLGQKFVDDITYYAAGSAEKAPTLLPKIDSVKDFSKQAVSKVTSDRVAAAAFGGTIQYGRDANGVVVDTTDPAHANIAAGVVFTDDELRTIFNFNAEEIALYREARAGINQSLDDTAKSEMIRMAGDVGQQLASAVMDAPSLVAAYDLLVTEFTAQAAQHPSRDFSKRLSAIGEQYGRVKNLKQKGYTPLMRFGEYTLTIKINGNVDMFMMYETARERNMEAAKLQELYGPNSGATFTKGTLSTKEFEMFQGLSLDTLEQFGAGMGLTANGASSEIMQEYLAAAKNNRSALKRLIKRKGVKGYSTDITRVLASFIYSNARRASGNINLSPMNNAILAIPKEKGSLKDEAMRFREFLISPQDGDTLIRPLMFTQYLGGSVASAAVNLTQPFMVTAPWLSQYSNFKDSTAEIVRAANEMRWGGKAKFDPKLQLAMQRAQDDGTLAPQEIFQLMEQAQGGHGLRQKDGTLIGDSLAIGHNYAKKVGVLWGSMFGMAEQYNRQITFIAAYRTAQKAGMPDPDAFARTAVVETQFMYTKASKMRFARNKFGGLLLTFKTYTISYLELMWRLWNKNGSPQEKMKAKMAMVGMLGMLMLAGGIDGLPFMEDMEDIADTILQRMDYNISVREKRKELIQAALAIVLGETIAAGTSKVINSGASKLPFSGVDVSGRLGMGNLIPATGMFKVDGDIGRDILEIGGAPADFVSRIHQGVDLMMRGKPLDAALIVSPTAVRNFAKGGQSLVTGEYRDTKGNLVTELGVAGSAAKMLGFQPSNVADVGEMNFSLQRKKAFYNKTAEEVRDQWARGILEDDKAKVEAARERMARWNENNPDFMMKIRMPDIMKRVRNMRKHKVDLIIDSSPRHMRQGMREKLADESLDS